MSVKEVTFYRVECDAEGCTVSTEDMGDYAAWADPGAALDEWGREGEARSFDDGRTLCREHAQPYVCVGCEAESTVPLEVVEDDDRLCPKCADDWHQPCGVSGSTSFGVYCAHHGGRMEDGSDRCFVAIKHGMEWPS